MARASREYLAAREDCMAHSDLASSADGSPSMDTTRRAQFRRALPAAGAT
jgi:hypothetical protein